MNDPLIIFQKDNFIFRRNSKHHYSINFHIENNNIYLDKLLDFGLIKLIYDLNPDIYLTSSIEKLNENEAIITLLLKHFFEDLGLPQRYSYVHMIKKTEENKVIFSSKTIHSQKPQGIPENAEQMSIENLVCICDIITPHNLNFTFDIYFDSERILPPLPVQKIIGVLINKIFKRVKQFIENM